MESIPISEQGFARVYRELERLKAERPAIIQAIKEAREEGDLSENAGYEAARERQSLQEARISYIESRMARFNVVKAEQMRGERIAFGATVRLKDTDSGQERGYTLVGPDETDFIPRDKNAVSVFSPVGRALLGRESGDEVVVDVPKGKIFFEVMEVSFNGPFIKEG
ncbi:MAG: transcription elongation factor GreA [Desulfovibrio sp.]|jgi:transcription elongation factor GreA|nr:transcription elongation factor GreA [Desulfovibrio sp.]